METSAVQAIRQRDRRIERRPWVSFHPAVAAGGPPGLLAHHGFGSFDIKATYYIAGRIVRMGWSDPHIMLDLEVSPGLRVPEHIWSLAIPDNGEIAIAIPSDLVALPVGPAPEEWELTMPSLARAEAIGLARELIEPGREIAGIGYRGCDPGDREFRADLLIVGTRAFVLRPFALPPETCL